MTERVEKHPLIFLAVWSAVYFLVTGWVASTKPLWADELITSYLSRLPSIGAMWSALLAGGDAHPPLSFLLVRCSYALFGVTPLSSRLPFIVAFWIMCLCIFGFVRARCGSLYGLAAISLALLCGAYPYACEARPYALVLAATAAALLAWQRACSGPSPWARAGLFLSLVAAVSSHFFGALVFAAVAGSEAVRAWRKREFDWGIWLAIVAALAPLPFYLPIARGFSALYFQAGFWSRPSPASVADTYRTIIDPLEPPTLLVVVLWALLSGIRARPEGAVERIPLHERAALLLLILFPVYAVAASFVTGAYTERYGLPAAVGITIGLAFFAYIRARADRRLALIAFCIFSAWFLEKQIGVIRRQMAAAARPFEGRSWVKQAESSPLPLVLSDSNFFTEFQEYAPPGLKGKFLYLTSTSKAMLAGDSPAGDTNVLVMNRLLRKLPTKSYEEFAVSPRSFLLCVRTGHEGWLLKYLLKSGARVNLRAEDGEERLFEVSL